MSELDNPDLVISIGGDGTFNESMTGNLKGLIDFYLHIYLLVLLMI